MKTSQGTKVQFPLRVSRDGEFVKQTGGTTRLFYEGAEEMVYRFALGGLKNQTVSVTDHNGAIVSGPWNAS